MKTRPTVAVIDKGALKHNYRELRKRISPGTGVMAVVKADAYGHGDTGVAGVLESLGCECFAVATVEEGERLRQAGIKRPVAVLGGIYAGQIEELFALDLTPVIFDMDTSRMLDREASRLGVVKNIHVKIDTGMGRLGVLPHEVAPFFEELKKLGHLRVEGVLSHFSEAGDRDFSILQLELFKDSIKKIRTLGFAPEVIHMANSAALVDLRESHFNLVRPGIMLYGSYPSEEFKDRINLRPVMTLRTALLHVKRLPPGRPVSYGRTFVTERESLIGVLPIGYADGLPRELSNSGEVLVRGRRVPIVGLVCMDLTMVDLTALGRVNAGEEVVVMGGQGGERITAEEVARRAGTISYEIFTNISSRVPRVFV